jgi:hypothetical protein
MQRQGHTKECPEHVPTLLDEPGVLVEYPLSPLTHKMSM